VLGGQAKIFRATIKNLGALEGLARRRRRLRRCRRLRPGFKLPSANPTIGEQLARGIRVELDNYMSSRHHNEFWVKGGFATIDASPFDVPVLNRIMEHTTIRAGHTELN
jgi:hypothetical protein